MSESVLYLFLSAAYWIWLASERVSLPAEGGHSTGVCCQANCWSCLSACNDTSGPIASCHSHSIHWQGPQQNSLPRARYCPRRPFGCSLQWGCHLLRVVLKRKLAPPSIGRPKLDRPLTRACSQWGPIPPTTYSPSSSSSSPRS